MITVTEWHWTAYLDCIWGFSDLAVLRNYVINNVACFVTYTFSALLVCCLALISSFPYWCNVHIQSVLPCIVHHFPPPCCSYMVPCGTWKISIRCSAGVGVMLKYKEALVKATESENYEKLHLINLLRHLDWNQEVQTLLGVSWMYQN